MILKKRLGAPLGRSNMPSVYHFPFFWVHKTTRLGWTVGLPWQIPLCHWGHKRILKRTFVFKVEAKETDYGRGAETWREYLRRLVGRGDVSAGLEIVIEFKRWRRRFIPGRQQEKHPGGWSPMPHELRSHFTEDGHWRAKGWENMQRNHPEWAPEDQSEFLPRVNQMRAMGKQCGST